MDAQEYDLIYLQAQRRVALKITTDYLMRKAEEDPLLISNDPRWLEAISAYKNGDLERKDGRESEWLWFTVNPDPSNFEEDEAEALREFMQKVSKAVGKKWVLNARYVFERYTKNGERVHMHMVLKKPKNKRPSEVKRELWNTFKDWCGNEKHVKVVFLYSPEVVQQKLAYLEGEKQEGKMENVSLDNKWRKEMGIQRIYDAKQKISKTVETENKDS